MEIDYSRPVRIDVAKLARLFSPFENYKWKGEVRNHQGAEWFERAGYVRISLDGVSKAISKMKVKNGEIYAEFESTNPDVARDEEFHEAIVAKLCLSPYTFEEKYAIDIDFGTDSIGGLSGSVPYLEDGYHRLAAAIFIGRRWIFANVSGSEDRISEFLYRA